jgi:virginiamycin A acetyltransferase
MTSVCGPSPDSLHPMAGFDQIVYLKNLVSSSNIDIGDYSYYDDPNGAEQFLSQIYYHFDFIGDKLKIGKFCAIARGVHFLMNGGNHSLAGFSSYPFFIFGNGWESSAPHDLSASNKGDTEIGHDVWLGFDAAILPGIKIGNGAVIGAKSVVTRDVPAYAVVGGNPAKVIRYRFDDATIAALQAIAWWHWPADKITRNLAAITAADLTQLEKAV